MGVFLASLFIHFLVVVTPGPANILIMQHSASNSRAYGLGTAAGVVTGATMWATIVFFALTFSYTLSPNLSIVLSIVGAVYLGYLGFRIFEGRNGPVADSSAAKSVGSLWVCYLEGFLLHATNPKAFFGWMAIISVGGVNNSIPAIY